ncbi:MAG: T9SS type A sorting domain-containing protein [Breznakibacter sp.]
MKTIKLLLYTILLAVISFASLNAQTNLVSNGSFETVGNNHLPADWTFVGVNIDAFSMVEGDDNVHEGTKALKIASTIGNGSSVISQEINEVIEGEQYDFSFQYKGILVTEGGYEGVTFTGFWMDGDNNDVMPLDDEFLLFLSDEPLPAVEGAWLPFSITGTVPETALKIKILIGVSGNNEVIFDDIRVTKVGDDSPTGIEDTKTNTMFKLNTNPVISDARFAFDAAGAGARIVISDLGGKTVGVQSLAVGDREAVVPVTLLPKGIYMATYTDNEGKKATTKVVK